MNEEPPNPSLSEQDYLDTLDIVTRLHQCTQRQDFLNVAEHFIFPLLEVHTATYGWTAPDLRTHSMVNIGPVSIDSETFKELTKYEPLTEMIVSQSRSVLAHHVDLDMEELNIAIQWGMRKFPGYKEFGKTMKGALLAFDRCAPGLGIGFHRHHIEKPIGFREIRLLELLRPHLMHTIKTVTLREELRALKAIVNQLMEIPVPAAILNNDMRLSQGNTLFKDLFPLESGDWLPDDLTQILRKEVEPFSPPFDIDPPKVNVPFYKLPQGECNLNLMTVIGDDPKGSPFWLLRLQPVDGPFFNLNFTMQKVGLTSRETEVAILLKDAIPNEEIAARLFISLNTVKKHIKEIYQKFGVTDRPSLTALLQ